MFNIDLSFFNKTNLLSDNEDINVKYNSLYCNKIIECLHSSDEDGCSGCEKAKPSEVPADVPIDSRDIYEARTTGLLGDHFCELKKPLSEKLKIGDMIIVGSDGATEISMVIQVGEIVKLKRHSAGMYGEKMPVILRKASENDIKRYERNLAEEKKAKPIFLNKVAKYGLNMKFVDVHYQFDRNKLFFFYTADGRVDFRELAKDLASEFRTRIELRQIGVRDEAKRVGGLGTCGREFCCSSYLNNFKRITTQYANEQNLSSNISKLTGPCGKLKCCLSYEVDEI